MVAASRRSPSNAAAGIVINYRSCRKVHSSMNSSSIGNRVATTDSLAASSSKDFMGNMAAEEKEERHVKQHALAKNVRDVS